MRSGRKESGIGSVLGLVVVIAFSASKVFVVVLFNDGEHSVAGNST